VYHHRPAFTDRWSNLPRVAGAPTSSAVTLCPVSSASEGTDPLHNVQSLVSLNLLDIPTARFTISSPRVSLKVFLDALSCLEPWLLIPFVHSGAFQRPFVLSRLFGATLSLPWSLRRAIRALSLSSSSSRPAGGTFIRTQLSHTPFNVRSHRSS
jgi:hypothetical protein